MEKRDKDFYSIIQGMRAAFERGENSMEWCRKFLSQSTGVSKNNEAMAILVAYDLQAGSYVASARKNKEKNNRWCRQIGGLISEVLEKGDSVLEVGVGEATTLVGAVRHAGNKVGSALGFDLSWSRLAEAKKWLKIHSLAAELFVGDVLNIPLADNSVDVVFSSHSLEPNRGKEEIAIRECLRIARRAVVLVEPIYELAFPEAQARMRRHGYVEGLKKTAEKLDATIKDYRLLEYSPNPLNPSGVLHLKKKKDFSYKKRSKEKINWRCPVSSANLKKGKNYFYAPKYGLVYPVLCGIPLLRTQHVIVASKFHLNK